MAETNFSPQAGKDRAMTVKTKIPERYGTLENSSDALAKLITDSSFNNISGVYFDRSTKTARSSELSYDKTNALELWNKSMEYVSEYLPDSTND